MPVGRIAFLACALAIAGLRITAGPSFRAEPVLHTGVAEKPRLSRPVQTREELRPRLSMEVTAC